MRRKPKYRSFWKELGRMFAERLGARCADGALQLVKMALALLTLPAGMIHPILGCLCGVLFFVAWSLQYQVRYYIRSKYDTL